MHFLKRGIPRDYLIMLCYLVGRSLNLINLGFLFPAILPEELLGSYHTQLAFGFLFSRLHFGESALRAIRLLGSNKRLIGSFFYFLIFITTALYWGLVLFLQVGSRLLVQLGVFSSFVSYFSFSHLLFGYILLLAIMVKFCYIGINKLILPNFLQNILLPSFQLLALFFYFMGSISERSFLFFATFFAYGLDLFLLLFFLYKKNYFYFSFRKDWLQLTSFFPFLGTSLFILLINALPIILPKIDILIIRRLLRPSFIGLYGTVAAWLGLLDMPAKTAKQIFLARLSPYLEQGKKEQLSRLYRYIGLYQFYWTGLLFTLLLSLTPLFVTSLSATYQALSQQLLLLLGLGKLFDTLFQAGNHLLLTSNYFLRSALLIPFFLLGIGGSYLSVAYFSVLGPAYTTLLTTLMTSTLLGVVVQKTFKIKIISLQLFSLLTFVSITLLIAYLPPSHLFTPWKEIGIKVILLLLFYRAYAAYTRISSLAAFKE